MHGSDTFFTFSKDISYQYQDLFWRLKFWPEQWQQVIMKKSTVVSFFTSQREKKITREIPERLRRRRFEAFYLEENPSVRNLFWRRNLQKNGIRYAQKEKSSRGKYLTWKLKIIKLWKWKGMKGLVLKDLCCALLHRMPSFLLPILNTKIFRQLENIIINANFAAF